MFFFFFCDFRVPARKLASPSGHPIQVSTPVQLAATREYLRVRGPGFRSSDSDSRTSQAEAMYYLLFPSNTLYSHNASRHPVFRLRTGSSCKSLTATGRAETEQAESEVVEGGWDEGSFSSLSLRPILDDRACSRATRGVKRYLRTLEAIKHNISSLRTARGT